MLSAKCFIADVFDRNFEYFHHSFTCRQFWKVVNDVFDSTLNAYLLKEFTFKKTVPALSLFFKRNVINEHNSTTIGITLSLLSKWQLLKYLQDLIQIILDNVLIDDYWKYIENIAVLWRSFSILIDCKLYPRNLRTNNCAFTNILVFWLVLKLSLFTKIKIGRNFRTNHWVLWQRESSRIEHFFRIK